MPLERSPERRPRGVGARARFVWALLVVAGVSACQLVQDPADAAPVPVVIVDPPIERGGSTAAQEAAAATELARARGALEAGDDRTAATAAGNVIRDFPTTPGSSEALWILAQATEALGAFEEAAEAADRFAGLIEPTDERAGEVALVAARSQAGKGEAAAAVRRLLDAPPAALAPVSLQANEVVREQVRLVDTETLGGLREGVADDHPLLPGVLIEYGIGLYFGGDVDGAAAVAREVLASSSAQDSDRTVARSLLNGRIEETIGADLTIGLVVPASGSPTLQQYASDVREGVEVALQASAERRRRPVSLRTRDDAGDPNLSRRSIQQLEDEDVIAVVGPLLDRQLEEAAQGRRTRVTLVSPTSSSIPSGQEAVYSLAAPDPGAAEALARYAADRRYRRIALIYPSSASAMAEARAFLDAYGALGGALVQEFPYVPGATSFGEQLLGAEEFGAEALVMPVPDEDIELLAPQVSFFGLDTLGIQVLGTAAWGEETTLGRIDPRHTDGVVVASPRSIDDGGTAYAEFETAYEALHRKTLRSPIPAFGYDAANLILTAIEEGARGPADLIARVERIEGHRGATGTISIVDGRIVREHALFEVRDRALVPTGRTFERP